MISKKNKISSVSDHIWTDTGSHYLLLDEVQIDRECCWRRRKLKEAVYIKRLQCRFFLFSKEENWRAMLHIKTKIVYVLCIAVKFGISS